MSVSTIASASAWEGLRHRFAANRGMMVAVVIFGAMFAYYGYMQPVGLSSNVINTASNKGVLLALMAMAQTLPVLTAPTAGFACSWCSPPTSSSAIRL